MIFCKILITYLAVGCFFSLLVKPEYEEYLKEQRKQHRAKLYNVFLIILWPLVIYGTLKSILGSKNV